MLNTADGGVVNLTATNEHGTKAQIPHRNLLLPMMLAPPESLLISCILRENFSQAHQVNWNLVSWIKNVMTNPRM